MNNRSRQLRGFTLPLVTVLVFSLLSLVGALVAMGAIMAKRAAAKHQDLAAMVTLESAANLALDGLTPPFASPPPQTIQFNGREVRVEVQRPESKTDLNVDATGEILAAVRKAGGNEAVVERVEQALPAQVGQKRKAMRFIAFARTAQLGPSEEDCLRRGLTTGRWPQVRQAETQAIETMGVGDQVDVRVSIDHGRMSSVLWVRARYTGLPDRTWRVHEWRRLQVPRSIACGGSPP